VTTRAPVTARDTATVFLAALAPMMTVPAIRRLLVDGHRCGPGAVHAFVAVGMLGAVVGAPLVARRCDARGWDGRLAAGLAAVDAIVTYASSLVLLPVTALFALRLLHGAASMALLALLFARFRDTGRGLVSSAGAAMVAALAVGPAVGGMLSRLGAGVPFRAAAAVSVVIALAIASRGAAPSVAAQREERRARPIGETARAIAAPIAMVVTQRFAIGGFVATFAIHARARLGWDDARVGAGFSLFLAVFALAMVPLGRLPRDRVIAWALPAGGCLFGSSLAALGAAPPWATPGLLAAAGLGGAMVYAPSLAVAAERARSDSRATAMALLNASGSVGMVLGPTVAGLLHVVLAGRSSSAPGVVFLAFAGGLHAVVAAFVVPRFRTAARSAFPRPFENQ
jgi:MFS family permease